jgi:hypothetical protein
MNLRAVRGRGGAEHGRAESPVYVVDKVLNHTSGTLGASPRSTIGTNTWTSGAKRSRRGPSDHGLD